MKLRMPLSFFLVVFLSTSLAAQEIYVAPTGLDSNRGSLDQPLKSISAAQKMAISSLQEHPGSEVTVWMADGIYPISEPLVFGPRELGEEGTLVFKAQQDAQPVISGGVEISGWIKNSEGLWEAALPKELDETSGFRELFISGKRAARARFPNEGYLRVKQAGVDRRTNFYFQKGDFPIPVNLEGVELVFLHDWSISRIGIQEIDTAADQLIAVDSIGARVPAFFTIDNWEPHPRYFLENAPEFLDADYEWIFLKSQNKVLLKLPQNVNPTNLKVSIPFSQGLIVVGGEENYPVKNIHFEGITFQYSKWEIPEKGYAGIQACHFDPRPSNEGWAVVPAAIISIWSENITFTDCNFRNLGGSGIWFGPGSKNCKIIDSSLKDIAGNGIMIGEGQDRIVNGQPWWKSAPEQVASGNVVENSTISQVGSQFYGAVGIWCGLTAQTAIKNNVLFDLPYTGISVGWMWSPEATPARENIISGNHIHEIMNILSDGGGIYLLGLQPESKVLDNRIHGVKVNAGRAESNGMFLDEGITGVLVEGNLVYDIAKSPLRFHRATTNLVRGNFFFSDDSNPPIRYNTTDEEAIEKVDNLFFSEGEPSYQKELSHAISRWEKKQRKKRKR